MTAPLLMAKLGDAPCRKHVRRLLAEKFGEEHADCNLGVIS